MHAAGATMTALRARMWIVWVWSSTLPFRQKLSRRAPVSGCMRGV
jgi:hypothetical protein